MRLTGVGRIVLVISIMGLASSGVAADKWGLKQGNPALNSAGPLTFGPDGILFIGDTKAATIFAIDTGDTSGDPATVDVNIEGLTEKVASALGVEPKAVTINDLAVNPLSGNIYLSVSKGEDQGTPALVRIDAKGKLTPVQLEKVGHAKVALPNPPEDKVTGEGRRRGNRRGESITDLAYTDNKVIVSGLSDGESPSTVREIAFPFLEAEKGTSIEIYHGAHGRLEDYSAPRTFVPFSIKGEPHLLAGFTCTPLVKFPVRQFEPGKKIRGTTVAELGNRNRPLDMIVYKKNGQEYLLMANSNRGVMKISTYDIERDNGITEPIRDGGTSGQPYETIKELEGVVQLDRLTDERGVIVTQTESGALNLATIKLP